MLTAAQLQRRFPLVRLPPDYTAVLNREAGVLHATKAVSMMLALARSRGAVVRDRTQVLNVQPLDDGRVEVRPPRTPHRRRKRTPRCWCV